MQDFEPILDYFQRRQARNLSERASSIQLVTESTRNFPGSFVYPGTDFVAGIQVGDQRVSLYWVSFRSAATL